MKPKYNEIFYEPAAGTGGFIHHCINYIKSNNKNKDINIFKNNIYANECNPEVYKSLFFNMLMRDIKLDNI